MRKAMGGTAGRTVIITRIKCLHINSATHGRDLPDVCGGMRGMRWNLGYWYIQIFKYRMVCFSSKGVGVR